jgi:hypothetical protein
MIMRIHRGFYHETATHMKRRRKKIEERAPIYCRDNPFVPDHMRRAVSRPNGLWRAEQKVLEKGTRGGDCWTSIGGDVSKEEAIAMMNNRFQNSKIEGKYKDVG